MKIDFNSLIALVSSRICHDMASPLQALTTAIDVLDSETSQDMRESAISLIRDSTVQASAKIDFMRAIFGSLTAGKGTLNLQDLRNITQKFIDTQKPILDWETEEEEIPRPLARIILNLIMVAIDSLPRGGNIKVSSQRHGDLIKFDIEASGLRVLFKPSMKSALMGEAPEEGFDGRTVQPYLTHIVGEENNIDIQAKELEGKILFSIRSSLV